MSPDEARDRFLFRLEDLEEMRQTHHLEDRGHRLGKLADTQVAAVLADLLDGSDEGAEARARHVGERPRVDDDVEAALIEDRTERHVEGLDGVRVDESDGDENRDLLALARFDGEFLFQWSP